MKGILQKPFYAAFTIAILNLFLKQTALALPDFPKSDDMVTGLRVRVEWSKPKKATVIAFLSAHCPCSASHEAELKKIAMEFTPQGFQFFGIHSNSDEEIEAAKRHFRWAGFSFPILEDAGGEWADGFGALKTPHIFVVSTGGEILYQGGIDDSADQSKAKVSYLRNVLTELSQGKALSVKETRTLGCRIRRRGV